MKTNTRNIFFTPGAALLGLILFVNTTASAAVFFQAVNQQAGGTDWTQAIWTNAAQTVPVVATSGNDYWVGAFGSTFGAVRTINTAVNPQSFAGDHLILTNAGVLWLKNAGAPCTANIILDGGQIQFHGSGGQGAQLGGTLQVNLNTNTAGGPGGSTGANFYNLGQDQTGANTRNILLQANVSGNGNLVVNMGAIASGTLNTVQISGTNTAFTGNWTNNQGTLEIVSGSVNPLGSGAVVVNAANNTFLSFNTTNNLVLANSIGGVGNVIKLNTNTVTLNGTNSYTGATTISNGVLQIGATSSITNSAVITLAGGSATLDVSAGGGLVMNDAASQSMNCNGTLIGNLTAATGNTLRFNLTPSTNDILNITGSLTLSGSPSLALTLSGFKPAGTYRLINYSGTIQGGGSFTLVPPVGSSQMFVLDVSTPGQVNVVVSGAVQNLTWLGDGSQNNWDTTTANWTGGTGIFSTGDNVTFNDSGSESPGINFVANVAPSSIIVSNTTKQYTFGVLAAPTQPGIVTAGSLTKKGANELIFATTGHNISGPIDIQAGTLTIGDGGGTGSLGTGSITNNGILQVNLDGGAVAFNAPISGSGSLVVTNSFASASTTVTIGGNGHNSYNGLTTIGNQCQLNIATSNALGSASSGTIVLSGGRLGVASVVGAMTVAEPVTINGSGLVGPFGALYVNDPANNVTWAGPITVASDSTIRGVNNSRMNFPNTVIGSGVALNCTVGNPITPTETSTIIFFQNTLSLGNAGSLVVDGIGTVVLEGSTNVWGGGTTIARGTLRVSGKLDGGTVTVDGGANFATLDGSGTILGPVSVLANGNLAPGGNSTIGTLTVSNTVSLTGTTLMQLNRTNAQNADLLAANSTTFGGTLTVTNIGPALQGGDTFQLFSGAHSGTFAVVNLPALLSPLSWDTSLFQSQGIIKVASSVAPTPVITAPAVSGTNFTLQVAASQSGFNYVLQATPALAPTAWTSIQTNAGTGGTLNFTIPIAPGSPQRFFRIQAQ